MQQGKTETTADGHRHYEYIASEEEIKLLKTGKWDHQDTWVKLVHIFYIGDGNYKVTFSTDLEWHKKQKGDIVSGYLGHRGSIKVKNDLGEWEEVPVIKWNMDKDKLPVADKKTLEEIAPSIPEQCSEKKESVSEEPAKAEVHSIFKDGEWVKVPRANGGITKRVSPLIYIVTMEGFTQDKLPKLGDLWTNDESAKLVKIEETDKQDVWTLYFSSEDLTGKFVTERSTIMREQLVKEAVEGMKITTLQWSDSKEIDTVNPLTPNTSVQRAVNNAIELLRAREEGREPPKPPQKSEEDLLVEKDIHSPFPKPPFNINCLPLPITSSDFWFMSQPPTQLNCRCELPKIRRRPHTDEYGFWTYEDEGMWSWYEGEIEAFPSMTFQLGEPYKGNDMARLIHIEHLKGNTYKVVYTTNSKFWKESNTMTIDKIQQSQTQPSIVEDNTTEEIKEQSKEPEFIDLRKVNTIFGSATLRKAEKWVEWAKAELSRAREFYIKYSEKTEKELTCLRGKNSDLEREKEELIESLQQYIDEKTKMLTTVKEQKDEIVSLQERYNNSEIRRAHFQNLVEQRGDELTKAKEIIDSLKILCKEAEESKEQLLTKNNNLTLDNGELRGKLLSAEKQKMAHPGIPQHNNEINKLKEQNEQLKEKWEKQYTHIKELQENIARITERNRNLLKQLHDIQHPDTEIINAHSNIVQEMKEEWLKERETFKRDTDDLRHNIKRLCNERNSIEQQLKSVTEAFQTSQQEQQKRLVKTFEIGSKVTLNGDTNSDDIVGVIRAIKVSGESKHITYKVAWIYNGFKTEDWLEADEFTVQGLSGTESDDVMNFTNKGPWGNPSQELLKNVQEVKEADNGANEDSASTTIDKEAFLRP